MDDDRGTSDQGLFGSSFFCLYISCWISSMSSISSSSSNCGFMKLFSLKLSMTVDLSMQLRLFPFFGDSAGERQYALFSSDTFSLISASICSSRLSLDSFHLQRISGPPPQSSFKNLQRYMFNILKSVSLVKLGLHLLPSSSGLLSMGGGMGCPLGMQASRQWLQRQLDHFFIHPLAIMQQGSDQARSLSSCSTYSFSLRRRRDSWSSYYWHQKQREGSQRYSCWPSILGERELLLVRVVGGRGACLKSLQKWLRSSQTSAETCTGFTIFDSTLGLSPLCLQTSWLRKGLSIPCCNCIIQKSGNWYFLSRLLPKSSFTMATFCLAVSEGRRRQHRIQGFILSLHIYTIQLRMTQRCLLAQPIMTKGKRHFFYTQTAAQKSYIISSQGVLEKEPMSMLSVESYISVSSRELLSLPMRATWMTSTSGSLEKCSLVFMRVYPQVSQRILHGESVTPYEVGIL